MAVEARLGLDIGGTFTDVVLETHTERFTAKVLTTPSAPEDGAMAALESILATSGLSPSQVVEIIHGTTLATNAIIERKGARTALLTTKGFRDSIEIGTEGRPDQYDTQLVKPAPLVARRFRFPVHERLDAQGNALVALNPDDVLALVPLLQASAIESVAIGFLHSYVNPAHEVLAARVLQAALPDLMITLSAEVSPEFREYERFSTACANAYIQPLMARYLGRFETMRRKRGFNCPMLLMLSGGGLTTIETARRFPVRLVESGPAGGAIFAGVVAQRCGLSDVVSFDMGGTTAKLCMIENGVAQTSRSFEVARVYRFKKGSGLPLRVPVVELVEIGAGGGSIARVDLLGRIAVGPDSASADPGPACYGRGGSLPTVTDANLAIGRIDPHRFAGGDLALAKDAADKAIATHVGSPLGLSVEAASFGISEMVDENMSGAARVHAIESGKSLPGRTLIAFGGGGPLHGQALAREMNIPEVVIPPEPGIFSAIGMLLADARVDETRTFLRPLSTEAANAMAEAFDQLEATMGAALAAELGNVPLTFLRQAQMRFAGQRHFVQTSVTPDSTLEQTRAAFETLYRQRFGHVDQGAPIEIVGLTLTATAQIQRPPLEQLRPAVDKPSIARKRLVYFSERSARIETPVYDRNSLPSGFESAGPAVIEEYGSTTIVGPDDRFAIGKLGEIRIRLSLG